MDPETSNQPSAISQDHTALTAAVSIRFTKQDAKLLRDEAMRRGFTTTVGFARSLILTGLSHYEDRSVLLEMMLRVEFLISEYFKAVSPEEEQESLESIREKAEAVSMDLLERFVRRRNRMVQRGENSGT